MTRLAKLFGKYTIGVDFSNGVDKSVKAEGYTFFGKIYITKIKVIE